MQANEKFFRTEESKKKITYIIIAILCLSLVLILIFRMLGWVKNRQESRALCLVNQWNSFEASGYKPRLRETEGGLRLDKQCCGDFEKMMEDCRKADCRPLVISAYRDRNEQQKLFEAYRERIAEGEEKNFEIMAVLPPGRSEHELGLAVDIVDESYPMPDEKQAETESSFWLRNNSWRYGFILRYPEGREETTGIAYSPWHYRYVGLKAAEQIHDMGICLEDYIEMFYSEEAVIIQED